MADPAQIAAGIGPPPNPFGNVGMEQLGNQASARVGNSLQNIGATLGQHFEAMGRAGAEKGRHQQRSLAQLGETLAAQMREQRVADEQEYNRRREEAKAAYDRIEQEYNDPRTSKPGLASALTSHFRQSVYNENLSILGQQLDTAAQIDKYSREGTLVQANDELRDMFKPLIAQASQDGAKVDAQAAALQAQQQQAASGKAPATQPATGAPAGSPSPQRTMASAVGGGSSPPTLPSSASAATTLSAVRDLYNSTSSVGKSETLFKTVESMSKIADSYHPELAKGVTDSLLLPSPGTTLGPGYPPAEVPLTIPDYLATLYRGGDQQRAAAKLMENYVTLHQREVPPTNVEVAEKVGPLEVTEGVADAFRIWQQQLTDQYKARLAAGVPRSDPSMIAMENTLAETPKIDRSYMTGVGSEGVSTKAIRAFKESGSLQKIASRLEEGIQTEDIRQYLEEANAWQDKSLADLDEYYYQIRAEHAPQRAQELLDARQAINDQIAPRGAGLDIGIPFLGTLKIPFGKSNREISAEGKQRLAETIGKRTMRELDEAKGARRIYESGPGTIKEWKARKKQAVELAKREADGSVFQRPTRGESPVDRAMAPATQPSTSDEEGY